MRSRAKASAYRFIKPSRYLRRFVPVILDLIKLHIGGLPVVQL